MKKHDWILENINNQDFSPTDFKSIGMSTADTQLLPMDVYLKSSYITDNPLFKNDNGEFSKDKFKQFYDQKALDFYTFSQDYDTFQYDLFDTSRKVDSQIKNPHMQFRRVSNPQHLTIGIGGRNEIRKSDFTDKELAQRNKIFDPNSGQFLDYSVNDYALTENPLKWFSQFFEDPIVYATWDKDGSHVDPITGELVKHVKGEFKVNDDGEFYTEKLRGRNIRDKQIVSILDNITVDGQGINSYDLFDADSFDKSATGSILSAATSIIPLFCGPEVAGIYSGVLIARELSKAIPMLSGMIDGVLGTDLENTSLFNFLAAKGEQFTQGTSQYAQENMFSTENLSKLISDVTVQWGQQKLIAQSLNRLMGGRNLISGAYKSASADYFNEVKKLATSREYLSGELNLKAYTGAENLNNLMDVIQSGEWTKSAVGKASLAKYLPQAQKINDNINRIGANTALAYMAIVSNTDVYDSMLDHGATKGEAALFALGSTLGMYGVDRYLGLGEMFFDELADNSGKFVRRNVGEMLSSWKGAAGFGEEVKDLNRLQKIIKSGKDFGAKYANKFADDVMTHTTGFASKAIGEGLEEVSEELVTDFTKSLYEQLGNLGITTTNDVGAWENMGARYLMSFLGGSLGGGIFYGVGMYNGQYPIHVADEDVLYHIRNGKTKDYLKLVDEWEKEGKFGSTELSATQKTEVTDEAGQTKEIFLTATDQNDTQNHFIAQRIREGILQLDAIINGNQLNLNENQLFTQMVGAEKRYLDLRDWLQKESYITGYQEMWQNIVKDLVQVDQDLLRAGKTIEGTVDGTPISDEWRRNHKDDTVEGRARSENLQKLIDKKQALLKQKENFLNGDTSLYYTRKMLFALDRKLSSNFFPNTFEEFVAKNHNGVSVESLNDVDREKYMAEYEEYQEKEKKNVLTQEFEQFLDVEKKVSPYLSILSENSKEFATYAEQINKIFEETIPTYTDVLEGETKEDVEKFMAIHKSVQDRQEVSPEDFDWYNTRIEAIDTLRKKSFENILHIVEQAGDKIDPLAYRNLLHNLIVRRKDIADDIVQTALRGLNLGGVPSATAQEIKVKLSEVTPENKEEIFNQIISLIETPIEQEYRDKRQPLIDLMQVAEISADQSGSDYEDQSINEALIDAQDAIVEGQEQLIEYINNYIEDYKNKFREENSELSLEEQERAISNNLKQILLKDVIQDDLNNIEKVDITPIKDSLQQVIGQIAESIASSSDLQTFDSLKEKLLRNNPFIKFISAIGGNLGIDGIEEQLQFIFNQIQNIDRIDNFRLTPEQMTQFEKVEGVLKLVRAYLYAASHQASVINPYGHNKAINDYIKNHQSELTSKPELLPELDDTPFVIFINEGVKYLQEIDYLTKLSRTNSVNKARRFLVTDAKFTDARLKFLDNIREHLKFNLKEEDVDLFKGYESVGFENDSTTRVNILEELLFNNLQNLIKQGNTVDEIFLASGILENLCDKSIYQQHSTRLDEDLDYDKFTTYDRLIYFFTILSTNNREWHKFLKDKINQDTKHVPLTVQQYVSKIVAASLDKTSIFNFALNYIQKNNILTVKEITNLKNTVFIPGIGGAGKSSVCAKHAVDYATEVMGINQDKIWLTAPEDTQRTNLKTSVIKGTVKSKEDIFKVVLDPTTYNELMQDINNNSRTSKYYTVVDLPGGNEGIQLNWDTIKLNKDTAPDILIIDEVTHFSNAELQILDNWVKNKIITLGDPNQDGFSNIGNNIAREQTFTIRTPKLRISLRDNNLQNQENQLLLSAIMDEISEKEANDSDYENSCKKFIESIDKFKVRAYNGTKLNGTLYQKELTDDVVGKLSEDIAFVGDANSQTLATLKAKGLNPKVCKTVKDIQGSEFEFIVVDYNFKPDKKLINHSDYKYRASGYMYWVKEFYTLISRAKTGSIFIDNGNLIGQQVIDSFEATAPSILDAIDQFKGPQLAAIDKYLETTPPVALETTEKPHVEREDLQDNPEDEEEEETNEQPEQPEQDNDLDNVVEIQLGDVTYPVYTNFNILGAKRDLVTVDDKQMQKWYPARKGSIKRDAEIFIKRVVQPKDKKIKDRIESDLRALISGILYQHSYDEVRRSIAEFDTIIGKETYEKLKDSIRLEVRPVDPDRDLIMNPIFGEKDPTVRTIGHDKLVALVAEADGIKVTLGLFADPTKQTDKDTIETLSKSIDKTINRIQTIIEQEKLPKDSERRKAWEEAQDRLLKKRNSLTDDAQEYAKKIDELTQNDQSFKVNVSLNGFSRLHRIDRPQSLSNLRKNKNLVVSSPLIYRGGIPGIDDETMRGKAVVLVSGDTILKPSELEDIYLSQKQYSRKNNTLDPEKQLEELPRVRMVVLSSQGVGINELITRTAQAPMAWTQVGIKLLVSTWNFRADLKNFLEEYRKFLEETGYESSIVQQTLVNMDAEYRKQPLPYTIENYEEIKSKIEEFNKGLANKVKEFRLGGREEDYGDTKVGSQYIRKLEDLPKESIFYKDTKDIYGVYITPERAEVYNKMLDEFFKAMSEIVDPTDSTTNKTLDATTFISATDKTANNINNYISQIHKNRDYTIVFPDGRSVKLGNNQKVFTVFAFGTLQVIRQAFAVSSPETDTGNLNDYKNITIKVGDDYKVNLNTTEILKNVKISPDGEYTDLTFENMFRIIVHGTPEDIHKKLPPTKASAAYFKKGIFVDQVKGNVHTNEEFADCTTDEDFFDVDVTVTSPILKLTLNDMTKQSEPSKHEEEAINAEEQQLKQIANQFGISFEYNNKKDFKKNKSDLIKGIKDQINSNISSIFGSKPNLESIIDFSDEDNLQPITLQQYIKSEGYDISEEEFAASEKVIGKQIVINKSDSTIIITYNSKSRKNLRNKIKIESKIHSIKNNDSNTEEIVNNFTQRKQNFIDKYKGNGELSDIINELENFDIDDYESSEKLTAAIETLQLGLIDKVIQFTGTDIESDIESLNDNIEIIKDKTAEICRV